MRVVLRISRTEIAAPLGSGPVAWGGAVVVGWRGAAESGWRRSESASAGSLRSSGLTV